MPIRCTSAGSAELVSKVLPADVFVTCSYDILPEIREYERTSTTVVNAFLGPIVSGYLENLTDRLRAAGIDRPLHIMQSSGGQMSAASAATKPAYLIESGPAAGVIAAARIAKRVGLDDVITLDMGGTTAKTAIIEGGEPAKTNEYEIGAGINLSSKLVKGAGYAIKLPFIDVSEIGAGGGSLVWIDKGGLLQVGPESAASVPGPVCYGTGGEQATLTDIMLALGYINPGYLVGGSLKLEPDKARRAIEQQVCPLLGKPLSEAAFGVFTIAVANMMRAVKAVSTYRGRDPRNYTLIAFGGNGPVVALAIARELAMKQVLVPPSSGVFSALGLLLSDAEHELVKSLHGVLHETPPDDIQRAHDDLIDQARATLAAEGHDPAMVEIRRFADLRYCGQAFELTVPVDGNGLPDRDIMSAAFHDEHFRTYAHKSEANPVEIVNVRIVARVPVSGTHHPDREALLGRAADTAQGPVERMAYFGPGLGEVSTPVISRHDLAGNEVEGPVIIEEYSSTCVVPPGCRASLDAFANILILLDR